VVKPRENQVVKLGEIGVVKLREILHNMEITEIEGFKIGVTFSPGDMFESQQLLAMSMNGIVSTVYGPKKALYVLNDESGLARFQCWSEDE